MKRSIQWFIAFCFLLLQFELASAEQPTPSEIQAKVASVANTLVKRFYEMEQFHSVWIQDGRPNDKAWQALNILESRAVLEFPGVDYKTKSLKSAFHSEAAISADTEVRLSDSLLLYLQHVTAGKTNFQNLYPNWKVERKIIDPVEILMSALKSENFRTYLEGFPATESYSALRKVLSEYALISEHGGWPSVTAGDSLSFGMVDSRVLSIRRRLQITQDLPSSESTTSEVFDEALDLAVRAFQSRHGLNVDGVVGTKTLAEMNISVHERIRQLQVNLERLRWMPIDSGSKYVIVNVPAYELDVYNSGQRLFQIRAIVGRKDWCTPIFLSSRITEIILNPYWYVPRNIAVKEILRLVQKNPDYLRKNGIKVFRGDDASHEVPGNSINWIHIKPESFPYQLRQEPGASNSLGRIKFVFPNECGCYIHDTPNKDLFAKDFRSFSHGCIRIENPLALASFLFGEDPSWTVDQIENHIDSGITQTIGLPDSCPLYLVYLTAWADNNTAQFRQDIYGQDRIVARALGSPLYD
jgi:L,D-transpeptidase YcbB